MATPGSSARGRGAGASGIEPSHRRTPTTRTGGRATGGPAVRSGERPRQKQHSEGRRLGRPHHIDVGGRRASVLDRNARHDRIERHIRRCRRTLHHSFGQGMFDPRALHNREPYRPARTAKPTRERSPERENGVLVGPSGCETRMRHPGSPGSTPDSAALRPTGPLHDCSPDPHSLRSPAKTRTGPGIDRRTPSTAVSFPRQPEAKRTQETERR